MQAGGDRVEEMIRLHSTPVCRVKIHHVYRAVQYFILQYYHPPSLLLNLLDPKRSKGQDISLSARLVEKKLGFSAKIVSGHLPDGGDHISSGSWFLGLMVLQLMHNTQP